MENAAVKRKMTKREKRANRLAYSIIAPFAVYYIIFSILPIFMVFFFSFTRWNGIGLDFGKLTAYNYKAFFTDKEYYTVLLNTLIFGAAILVLNYLLGFVFGYFMSRRLKFMGFFRTVWYLPVVVSMAVVSLILNTLIKYDGAINAVVKSFGGDPVKFKESVFWMYFWIIGLVLWKGLGGILILFIAGFSQIPQSVTEAAELDGAKGFKKLFYITIPMMKNMLVFILITSLMGVFSIFEPIYLVSGGGPNGKTNVIMHQIFTQAFGGDFQMGMSSAISVVVLLLTMGLSVMNMRLLGMGNEKKRLKAVKT